MLSYNVKSEFKSKSPFFAIAQCTVDSLFFEQLHDKDICHGISGETSPPKTTDLVLALAQKHDWATSPNMELLYELPWNHKLTGMKRSGYDLGLEIPCLPPIWFCWIFNLIATVQILDLISTVHLLQHWLLSQNFWPGYVIDMLTLCNFELIHEKNFRSLKFRFRTDSVPSLRSCIFDRCRSTNYFCARQTLARVCCVCARARGKSVFICVDLLTFQS